MIAIIVAYAKNRVIGYKGRIPWNIEGEKRRFKELTTNNVVVMGRKTFEEIGHPLPNRFTYVVSSTKNFDTDNCKTVKSLDEALKLASGKDIYIAGGQRLYEEAIKLADYLYITEIDQDFVGDTYFPSFDETKYHRKIELEVEADINYRYVTYKKIAKNG